MKLIPRSLLIGVLIGGLVFGAVSFLDNDPDAAVQAQNEAAPVSTPITQVVETSVSATAAPVVAQAFSGDEATFKQEDARASVAAVVHTD